MAGTKNYIRSEIKYSEDELGEEYTYKVTNTMTAGPVKDGFCIGIEYRGGFTTRDSFTLNLEEAIKLRSQLEEFIKNSA